MAKIDNYLRAILIARYGEDVRGSIHDAIELINSIAGIKYGTSVTSPTDPTGTYEEGTLYLNTSTGDLWSMIGKDLWDLVLNIIGPPGTNGKDGKDGQDAPKIVGNDFVSQVGLIRTYELVLDDGSTFQYQVSDGQSGSGTGDMTKSVYDINNDGKVDAAEVADKVGNANTTVLEDLSEDSDGDLNYKGNKIGGAVKVDGTTIDKNASNELTLASSVTAKLPKSVPTSADTGKAPVVQSDGSVAWSTVSGGGTARININHTEDDVYYYDLTNPTHQIKVSANYVDVGFGTYVFYQSDGTKKSAEVTVNVDTLKLYSVELSYFTAYITVNYPSYAHCDLIKDGTIIPVTGSGVKTTVPASGVWTIKVYAINTANEEVVGEVTTATITTEKEEVVKSVSGLSKITLTWVSGFDSVITAINDDKTQSGLLSGSSIEIPVNKLGEWTIIGTHSGKQYKKKVTINDWNENVSTTLKTITVYGFYVDSSNSSSSGAVSYEVDYDGSDVENKGFTPASMNFVSDAWDWGSWANTNADVENLFFMPKPCLIDQDYTKNNKIYLNPYDLTKDIDGNDVTSYLNGSSGSYNAMMEFGKDGNQIWYKLVPDSGNPESYTCYIADEQADDEFVCWSFYGANDTIGEHFYMAIYNGSNVSNTLRSLSGKSILNGAAGETEIQYAKANNKNNEEYAWYIDVLADRTLIELLTILITKSLNTDVIGYGNYTGGTGAGSLLQTGLGNAKGYFYGKQANSVCKVFGIENFYANQWRRMAGCILNNGRILYKLTYGRADGSSAKGYIETTAAPTNYKQGHAVPTNLSNSYIKAMTANTDGSLLASQFDGANGTYYSDGYSSGVGVMYALAGGTSNNSSGCGVHAIAVSAVLSLADANLGAAISLKPFA